MLLLILLLDLFSLSDLRIAARVACSCFWLLYKLLVVAKHSRNDSISQHSLRSPSLHRMRFLQSQCVRRHPSIASFARSFALLCVYRFRSCVFFSRCGKKLRSPRVAGKIVGVESFIGFQIPKPNSIKHVSPLWYFQIPNNHRLSSFLQSQIGKVCQ